MSGRVSPHFYVTNHHLLYNRMLSRKKRLICMEPTISLSGPSLVKKTCMTTKRKGKRREPSSLPHIRGARLLPSAGSLLSLSTRPVLSSPNGACVYMRACTRTHACLLEPRALKGACTARAKGEGVRGCACARSTCVESRSRMCVLARGEQVYAFPAFLFPPFDSLWRFSRVPLFTGLSFSLSKKRLARERCRDDVEKVLLDTFFAQRNKCQADTIRYR